MAQLVIGETYVVDNGRGCGGKMHILAQSPISGNYIGKTEYGVLYECTNDGRSIGMNGNIQEIDKGGWRLVKIPKTIEVEYEFWVNFYKDGSIGITYGTKAVAATLGGGDILETKRFTHKATYTE
jgi:hypothetical protein